MSKAITCPRCHAIFLEDYEPEQLDKLEEIEMVMPPNLKQIKFVKAIKVDFYEAPAMDASNGTDGSVSTNAPVTAPDLGVCSPVRCA